MKLYDVPNGNYVRLLEEDNKVPPGAPILNKGTVVFFHHLDGMYSFCKTQEGELVHLAAWEEVEIVDGWDEK